MKITSEEVKKSHNEVAKVKRNTEEDKGSLEIFAQKMELIKQMLLESYLAKLEDIEQSRSSESDERLDF